MTLSYLEVIRVMGGSNLYYTGTKLSVYISICNDRNHAVYDRKHYALTDQVLISLIFGMNGYSGITKHCLRTGGCKGQKLRGARSTVIVHDGVLDVPEMTCLLLIFYLSIGDGGVTYRTPVDDA